MIFKVTILFLLICLVILFITFMALRIPKLEIERKVSQEDKVEILDGWLSTLYHTEKFNGSVLLAKQGKILFSKAYGYDTVGTAKTLTEHSSFNLASVSKQFTAMGIVILKTQSKLDYHDKVSKYIPELTHYNHMTIEHLLHHTSGLPDYMYLSKNDDKDDTIFTIQKMLSLYNQHKPGLHFSPGEKFEYSNTGYVLLAEIIARVSGVSFHDFMSQEIFKPLKMNNTQVFNLLSKHEPENRVYGYKYKYWLFGGEKIVHDLNYFDGLVGDGGVYSSAHDLFLWHKALQEGVLVPQEIYNQAYVPAVLDNGKKTTYGYGWFVHKGISVEHAGGWQGFSSFIYRNIKNGDLIIVLDNSSNALRVTSIGCSMNSIVLNLKKFMEIY